MTTFDETLARINTLTKYPSIPTYHKLDERGRLTMERTVVFAHDAEIQVTEKIDGTNVRLLVFDPSLPIRRWIIGSREEFLTAQEDFIFNRAMGIVEHMRLMMAQCGGETPMGCVRVYFGEVYGGKVGAHAKNYNDEDPARVGFRLFDVIEWPVGDFVSLLDLSCSQLSTIRDASNQPFVDRTTLSLIAEECAFATVPFLTAGPPPAEVPETLHWLDSVCGPTTRAALGEHGGRAEGVIVRTADRKQIAKLRFEDYERTVRQNAKVVR